MQRLCPVRVQPEQLTRQFRVKERRLRIWRVNVGGQAVRGNLTQKSGQGLRTGVSLMKFFEPKKVGDLGEETYEGDDECHTWADVQEDGRCRHT